MRIVWAFDPSTLPVAGTRAPTQGIGIVQPSGLTVNGCGTLYFLNKSNTGVLAVFEDGSFVSLPAWHARSIKPTTKTNQIWLSLDYQLATTGNPISLLYLEAYQPLEDTSGLYNGPLMYETNVGNALPLNTAASSVTNDGNPAGTQVGESSLAGHQTFLWLNDGTLKVIPETNGVFTSPALQVVPGGAATFAVVQLDNALINTDGQGDLNIKGNTLSFLHALSGFNRQYILFSPSDGNIWAIQENTADHSLVIFDQTGSHTLIKFLAGGGIQFDAGTAFTDGAGGFTMVGLTTNTTPVLRTGFQESGHFESQFWTVQPSQPFVVWVPFKEKMTNVPTITLSNVTSTNITSGTVTTINKFGFSISLTSTAVGATSYAADWVTAGN